MTIQDIQAILIGAGIGIIAAVPTALLIVFLLKGFHDRGSRVWHWDSEERKWYCD